MRGKRKLKVHWVNGVEEEKSGERATQESVGIKNGEEPE